MSGKRNSNTLNDNNIQRKNTTRNLDNTTAMEVVSNMNTRTNEEILQNSNENIKIKINKYKRQDSGPFKIIVSKENINMLKLGKALKDNRFDNIMSVEQMSKHMARITFRNFHEANSCLESEKFVKFDGYKAFLPNSFNKTIGIIRNVPVEWSVKEISDNLKSNIDIEKIERMTKWDSKTESAHNMELIKITFNANYLPNNVVMYENIMMKVHHFIPNPLHCKRCLNFGYTINRCRANEQIRCQTCAQVKEEDHICDLKRRCKFCGEGHQTNDRECYERHKQRQIVEYMTINKTAYKESKDKIFGKKQQIPRQADFPNPNLKGNIEDDNRMTEMLIKNEQQTKILYKLVEELKAQVRTRDLLLKDIVQTLNKTEEIKGNPAHVDGLIIKITETLSTENNKQE